VIGREDLTILPAESEVLAASFHDAGNKYISIQHINKNMYSISVVQLFVCVFVEYFNRIISSFWWSCCPK
jgi:hypothetical protein